MHSQEDTKAGRSADLYFEVKLMNEVHGSVLNQEIHSVVWGMVVLLPALRCQGQPYLKGHFHKPTRRKKLSCFLSRSVAVAALSRRRPVN